MIQINLTEQKLFFLDKQGQSSIGNGHRSFAISSALNGAGQAQGSYKTPLGRHSVYAKIGQGLPIGSVFRGRRWTGEVCDELLLSRYTTRDWILSRILWLQGLEPGWNRGGEQDTRRRLIYIHGTHEEHLIGQPVSHGCIRMRNVDVAALFSLVTIGERVEIA